MLRLVRAVLTPVLQAYGGFSDQKAGTSGLRKKTAVFTAPHYTESAAQSFLSATAELEGALDGLACVALRLLGFHCLCDCLFRPEHSCQWRWALLEPSGSPDLHQGRTSQQGTCCRYAGILPFFKFR